MTEYTLKVSQLAISLLPLRFACDSHQIILSV